MTTPCLPRPRAVGALACAALALTIASAPSAAAHTALTGSDPGENADLTAPPEQVTLTFNDPMRAEYSRVEVTLASGDSITTGTLTADGTGVVQPLDPQAPAGQYTVSYRVVSADGHPVSGSFAYTVTPPAAGKSRSTDPETTPPDEEAAAPAEARAAEEASPAESGGGGPLPGAVVAVTLAVVGATAYGLFRRRSRRGR
ncbi:copper resistance CopC family protein [Streptomyces hainanensis]|nr:copper resistance protein CopC [Streptomyces hainanensis]